MLVRCGLLRFLLIIGALVGQSWAQGANITSPEDPQRQRSSTSRPDDDRSSEETGSRTTVDSGFTDWPVLVIPGVTDLAGLGGTGIVLGGGFSGGYGRVDTGGQAKVSGYIAIAQPYVGLYNSGRRHKVLVEYSPTYELYNQDQESGSVLQRGGVRSYVDLSKRLRWVFSGYTTYGTEYLRELGGISIGDYPGWLTFQSPTDKLFLASATTALHWRFRPLREFSVGAEDNYSSLRSGPTFDMLHNRTNYDATYVRAQLTNYFGHDSNWFAYAQANRYSNQSGCTRLGAGGGFVWNLNPGSTLALRGGPEWSMGDCSVKLTADFSGYIQQHLTARTVLYLSASRDFVEPYLLQTRWTDIYSGKLWRRTSQSTTLAAGAGYLTSSSLPSDPNFHYHALLLFSEFHWRLSDSFSVVSSYRYFRRNLNEPGFTDRHSWVFVSVVWHPLFRGMQRHSY